MEVGLQVAAVVSALAASIIWGRVGPWFAAITAAGAEITRFDLPASMARDTVTPTWLAQRQIVANLLFPVTFVLCGSHFSGGLAPIAVIGSLLVSSRFRAGLPRDRWTRSTSIG